jgi:hypothetical protein
MEIPLDIALARIAYRDAIQELGDQSGHLMDMLSCQDILSGRDYRYLRDAVADWRDQIQEVSCKLTSLYDTYADHDDNERLVSLREGDRRYYANIMRVVNDLESDLQFITRVKSNKT